jgi:hypothetical protein
VVQQGPTIASPVATPSQPHPPGGHGFEDSAVNEHARKMHHAAASAAEETVQSLFDRQTATDTLSNLSLFREEDLVAYEPGHALVQPSELAFHKEVLSKIKAVN